jgi:hypothetical protein
MQDGILVVSCEGSGAVRKRTEIAAKACLTRY